MLCVGNFILLLITVTAIRQVLFFTKLAYRWCYVSVYFLLFFVGFQLVTQFNKNNLEFVCRIKISAIFVSTKTNRYDNNIRNKRKQCKS